MRQHSTCSTHAHRRYSVEYATAIHCHCVPEEQTEAHLNGHWEPALRRLSIILPELNACALHNGTGEGIALSRSRQTEGGTADCDAQPTTPSPGVPNTPSYGMQPTDAFDSESSPSPQSATPQAGDQIPFPHINESSVLGCMLSEANAAWPTNDICDKLMPRTGLSPRYAKGTVSLGRSCIFLADPAYDWKDVHILLPKLWYMYSC